MGNRVTVRRGRKMSWSWKYHRKMMMMKVVIVGVVKKEGLKGIVMRMLMLVFLVKMKVSVKIIIIYYCLFPVTTITTFQNHLTQPQSCRQRFVTTV